MPRWRDERDHLPLRLDRNSEWFGSPLGGTMGSGFHELVARAGGARDSAPGRSPGQAQYAIRISARWAPRNLS